MTLKLGVGAGIADYIHVVSVVSLSFEHDVDLLDIGPQDAGKEEQNPRRIVFNDIFDIS